MVRGTFPDSEVDRGIGLGWLPLIPLGWRPFRENPMADIDRSGHGRSGRAELRWIAPRHTLWNRHDPS
jgi:hypothetical protein